MAWWQMAPTRYFVDFTRCRVSAQTADGGKRPGLNLPGGTPVNPSGVTVAQDVVRRQLTATALQACCASCALVCPP